MLLHFDKSDVIAFFCFVLYLIKHLDISLNICIIYEKTYTMWDYDETVIKISSIKIKRQGGDYWRSTKN